MFGHTLRMLRTAAGISLRALAKKVDVSPAYLSQVELGKLPPPTHTRIKKIADSIGIPVSLLKEMSHRRNPETDMFLRDHHELNDLIRVIFNVGLDSKEIFEMIYLMRALGGDGFRKLIHYGQEHSSEFTKKEHAAGSKEDSLPPNNRAIPPVAMDNLLVIKQLEFMDKSELLRYMIKKAGGMYHSLNIDHIHHELMDKEAETSSGLGKGTAIPHLFVDGLDRTIISIARIPKGIDFRAIDDKPVFLVCLILSNPDSQQRHLNLLAYFAGKFQTPAFADEILKANSKKRILSLLFEKDFINTH